MSMESIEIHLTNMGVTLEPLDDAQHLTEAPILNESVGDAAPQEEIFE
jgi:hypothetical protein